MAYINLRLAILGKTDYNGFLNIGIIPSTAAISLNNDSGAIGAFGNCFGVIASFIFIFLSFIPSLGFRSPW